MIVRLPIAIHTPPAVALEAENPQPAMARIISAFSARAAAFVMFTLPCPTVLLARSTRTEFGTARRRARAGVSACAANSL